jgi:4-aminobutyrate aminotransferase-like enzyme
LETIVAQRLWNRAAELGQRLAEGLRRSADAAPVAVRQIGALIGAEFSSTEAAQTFVRQALARGVILNWTLNAERVVRLAPPLTMGEEEIDFALKTMAAALEASRAMGKVKG